MPGKSRSQGRPEPAPSRRGRSAPARAREARLAPQESLPRLARARSGGTGGPGDFEEIARSEARAPDQRPVNGRRGEQARGVRGLDGAAVENADRAARAFV